MEDKYFLVAHYHAAPSHHLVGGMVNASDEEGLQGLYDTLKGLEATGLYAEVKVCRHTEKVLNEILEALGPELLEAVDKNGLPEMRNHVIAALLPPPPTAEANEWDETGLPEPKAGWGEWAAFRTKYKV